MEEVAQTLQEELGRPFEEVFELFDPKPLAAASIGQVHRAMLKDGTEVAVKVRAGVAALACPSVPHAAEVGHVEHRCSTVAWTSSCGRTF